MVKIIRYAMGIAMLLSVAAGCINDPEGGVILKTGDKMPEFTAVTLDGVTITPDSLRGHESVIVFFNTECSDCRRELPLIQLQADEEMPRGVKYLCISRQEGASQVAEYWNATGLTMQVSAQTDRAIYALFAKSGIPVTFRFDANLKLISYDDSGQ